MLSNSEQIEILCKSKIVEHNKTSKTKLYYSKYNMSKYLSLSYATFKIAYNKNVWSVDICKRLSKFLGKDISYLCNGQNYRRENDNLYI